MLKILHSNNVDKGTYLVAFIQHKKKSTKWFLGLLNQKSYAGASMPKTLEKISQINSSLTL